jgi:hypothetical protein
VEVTARGALVFVMGDDAAPAALAASDAALFAAPGVFAVTARACADIQTCTRSFPCGRPGASCGAAV